MSDHRGFTREEAETEAGRIRGVIVDEVGKRCGSPPNVHPRLLEGIEVAARLLAEQAAEDRGGDGPCRDCGKRYPPWHTDNAIWNLVVGGPDATDDPGGLLCPTCFLVLAETSGLRRVWRLAVSERPAVRVIL